MAPRPLKTCELPNGLTVNYPTNQDEIRTVYKENFEEKQYLQHGVSLRPGGTVIDIGAHAGVFALYAAQAVGPTGRVIALEPSPVTHSCCVANVSAHAKWLEATQGVRPAPVDALQLACSDGSADRLTLTVYDKAATLNSCYPNHADAVSAMKSFIFASIKEGNPVGNAAERALMRVGHKFVNSHLTSWFATPLASAVASVAANGLLSSRTEVSVQMVTVSSLISTMALSSVQLLKVDVERAELQVFRGVAAKDWPRIEQVAAEVHECGLEEVVSLLKGTAGFTNVVTTEADSSIGPGVYMVHATRQ